ncbi:hypothetical protein [Rosenbergiella epipactidis]|uniref:hypothetical protein n=1 Tax=Rosenbergiella epipactidis TaxID=1544694 RepID=UPI001F4DD7C6|nr:hypothetical protein [Rosenbergiella epipactidis]
MDNNTEKNTVSITKKRYFILGRPAWPLLKALTFIYFCLYFFYTPLYFTHITKFPEEDEIHYSEGLFTFKSLGKQKYQLGLITPTKTEFFSCISSYIGSHICEVNRIYSEQIDEELRNKGKFSNQDTTPILYKKWQGKPAKIAWFTQRYNIFSTDRRIVQVIIDGKEVLSHERVINTINSAKGKFIVILCLVVSSPIMFFAALMLKRIILNRDPFSGEKNAKN